MKRKSIFLFALALCLTMALTACGGNTGTGSNSAGGNSPTASSNTGGGNGGGQNTSTPAANNSTPSNNGGGNTAAKTPSITPAAGWVTDPDVPAALCVSAYKTDAALQTGIVLSVKDLLGKTADDYVKSQQDGYKKQYASYTISDITKTTVNGMDAQEFTMTGDDPNGTGYGNYMRMVYICQGTQAYVIQCSTQKDSLDSVKDAFQSMIDSFTLK